MSVPFEKELENVLTLQWQHLQKRIRGAGFGGSTLISDECDPKCRICMVKKQLLPLLEAGQACASACGGMEVSFECCNDSEDWRNEVMGPARKEIQEAKQAWDAARERLAQLEKR